MSVALWSHVMSLDGMYTMRAGSPLNHFILFPYKNIVYFPFGILT